MDKIIRDVTLETVNQAIQSKAGIKPGENFSIVVVDSSQPRRRLIDIAARVRVRQTTTKLPSEATASVTTGRIERLLSKAGVGVSLVGQQTTEEIDRRINKFRGDECSQKLKVVQLSDV